MYQQLVLEHVAIVVHSVPVWQGYNFDGDDSTTIDLYCWHLPTIPQGFTSNGHGKYQFDLRAAKYRSVANNSRPIAWRVAFADNPNYNNENYTVSHLCHNTNCYNWNHHSLELLPVNKGRNGCPGGRYCFHQKPCKRPGPYYNQ